MIETDARVARGVAALYLAGITSLVLNTIFLVLLANYYASNQAEVGLINFLNVVLVSAATLAVLALPLVGSGVVATPPAVTRFLSSRGEGAPSGRRVYLVSLALCGGISTAIVALASNSSIAGSVAGPSQAGGVFFACLDALVYSFAQLGAYALLGSDRATHAGKIIVVSVALRYTFASALLLAGWGAPGVFIGFAIGDSVLAVVANGEALRQTAPSLTGANMGPVFKYMASVFFAALMGLAVSQTDKLLAFLQLGLPPLAVYTIATTGAAAASFAPSAATNVLVPALSNFAVDRAKKLELVRAYTRHISLSAVPIGFELAAVSPFLLRIFGDLYSAGAGVMAVIAASIAFTAVASVYSSILLVEDRAHHFTLSNLAGLASLVAVAYLTVPAYGFFGIALGRAVMLFVMMGAVSYFVRRSGMLVLDRGAYAKSLAASAFMAVFVYGVLYVGQALGLGRLGLVAGSIVMIPIGFAYYLLIMKLLKAYTEEDMDFIDSLLPKWLRLLSRLARKLL
ncbi:MAG: polysaccharide biosynthesis C-terminal domain-containing protein [Thaumarchaeota archaeon]|nr:polysaccharide biosynthesis C-terminal domain-containing protein [Nitrososphaerota archaeon]